MTEYFARKDYLYETGDAIFSIPFSYLDKKHIVVFIEDVQTTNYTYLTDTQIKILGILPPHSKVSIRRTTPLEEKFVTFSDRSILDKDIQNLAQDQMFNVVQELYDNNTDFREELLDTVEQNAQEYLEKTSILQNRIDSTVDTVTEAVNLLDATTAKVEEALETCVEKAEIVNFKVDIAIEKAETVENLYENAVNNITQAQETAQNTINSALEEAKTELSDTKTQIVTDLIENATNEALTEVNNVKTSAIENINNVLNNAENSLNEAVSIAQNAATTATNKAAEVTTIYTQATESITNTKQAAIDEILEVKAGVVDDLVENAAGEVLEAVENTKNVAITAINSTKEDAQTAITTGIEQITNAKTEAVNTIINTSEEYSPPTVELVEDGDSCRLKIVDKNGTSVSSNLKGPKGDTPVKGVDYFTFNEINTLSNDIKNEVLESIETNKTSTSALSKTSSMYRFNQDTDATINIDLDTQIYLVVTSGVEQITLNIPELPENTALTFEVRLRTLGTKSPGFANVTWLEDTPIFESNSGYLLAFRSFGDGTIYGNVQGKLI